MAETYVPMDTNLHMWLIPVLPLLGALWNGLTGKHRTKRAVVAVGIGSVACSFALAVRAFFSLGETAYMESYGNWIVAGPLQIPFNFYLDPLSAVMALIVTGVGLLIHIYAAGSMAHDGGFYRFFCYMNLFLFFMLMLVLGGNYALLFVGWVGVGLCSYLLIGYRQQDSASAGRKAFLTMRIGDCCSLLGILVIYANFHSLNFTEVFSSAASWPVESGYYGTLTVICLLILVGAAVKSAQVPLHVWLPDAMLGPTPVSALILSATMVCAGVYVIARSSFLFVHSPEAILLIAIVVAIIALFTATIVLMQIDSWAIIRPLWSISQNLLWKIIDVWAIDGMMRGLASRVRRFGDWARRWQSGNIRSYAAWMVIGVILLIGFMTGLIA